MDTKAVDQCTSPQTEQAVIAWMQANALPLHSVEAGSGFGDLHFLRELLKDVKVVGLGEASHGIHETFQLKHRLVEFLVTEMGFTSFAMEASYGGCQTLNDYIVQGIGDGATALTAQGFVVWDTEEMAAMVDWMRAYNQRLTGKDADRKKVKFYGFDITFGAAGRRYLLDYLLRVTPERVAAATTILDALAVEDDKWPLRIDAQSEAALVRLAPDLQALLDYLTSAQESLVSRSSLSEFTQALLCARVMQRWVISYASSLRPKGWDRSTARSISMGRNLLELIEAAPPEEKFIAWAHNGHLSHPEMASPEPGIGTLLREKFGDHYFDIGFEVLKGTFQTRVVSPEIVPTDLKAVEIPPPPKHSLAWFMAHVDHDLYFLKLPAPGADPAVELWLGQLQPIHSIGWTYDPQAVDYMEMQRVTSYDAFIFIERSTASHPTPNAQRRVANHEWF